MPIIMDMKSEHHLTTTKREIENIIEQTLGYRVPFGVIKDSQHVGREVTILSCLTQITNLHLEDPNARAKSVS
uniref:Uncharacterized protein n=1 Tax=Brassica oleracea TaxID=3712 RepID=A0A3P6G2A2_BRAOL|nr:unnamed protein product [Brassica oleracea]